MASRAEKARRAAKAVLEGTLQAGADAVDGAIDGSSALGVTGLGDATYFAAGKAWMERNPGQDPPATLSERLEHHDGRFGPPEHRGHAAARHAPDFEPGVRHRSAPEPPGLNLIN